MQHAQTQTHTENPEVLDQWGVLRVFSETEPGFGVVSSDQYSRTRMEEESM